MTAKHFVRPLFHSDRHAVWLMIDGKARIANVHENSFGDQYFSAAFKHRETADAEARPRRWAHRTLYRIVVRPKT